MGAHYGVCYASARGGASKLGLKNVYFNDVLVPRVAIVVNSSNKAIVFGVGGPPWTTINIPEGSYDLHYSLAVLAEDLMNAAAGAQKYRVTYGFNVYTAVARSNQIRYATQFSGVENTYNVTLFGQYDYTGPELADEIERALNAHQATIGGGPEGTFSVTYNVGSAKFEITFTPIKAGYQHVKIQPMQGTDLLKGANTIMGFRLDQAKTSTANPGFLVGDFSVHEHRYTFAYDGNNATLKATDAGFTAEALFGLPFADQTLLAFEGSQVEGSGVEGLPPLSVPGAGGDLMQLYFNAGTLFGTEGGVSGRMDFYLKPETQPENWYLRQKRGIALPKWKKLVRAVQRGMYIGNSNFPKSVAFEIQAWPDSTGLPFATPAIGDDINPALAIYEILTNGDVGLGLSPSLIDLASFAAAGATLATEGFGLSVYLDDSREAESVIEEILQHIDGFRYRDPETGLWGLDLARDNYTVGALPLIDEVIAPEVVMRRPSWEETRNAVKVAYTDAAGGYVERVEQLHDLANVVARGGLTVVDEVRSSLVTTSANAKKLAERRLKASCRPMARFELPDVKRKAWKLREGSVFRLTRPALGITDCPCRVVKVRSGGPGSSTISIDAVEDVFGAAWSSWAAPTS
jgi:hypothetical protein